MSNKNYLVNDSDEDKLIGVIIYRVWQGTTYEQTIVWPKKTKLKKVLHEFQKNNLGDKHAYKIVGFYFINENSTTKEECL